MEELKKVNEECALSKNGNKSDLIKNLIDVVNYFFNDFKNSINQNNIIQNHHLVVNQMVSNISISTIWNNLCTMNSFKNLETPAEFLKIFSNIGKENFDYKIKKFEIIKTDKSKKI